MPGSPDPAVRPDRTGPASRSADAVDQSYWRPLRRLQQQMDAEIAALYAERGVGVATSHSMVLIRLATLGPSTITELADSLGITHSGASQKVTALRRQGYVADGQGTDRRSKVISLTEQGAALVDFLQAEWAATEAVMAEIDAELSVPLARWLTEFREALQRKDFRTRLRDTLDAAGDR